VLRLAAPEGRYELKSFFDRLITPLSCSLVVESQDIRLAAGSLAHSIYTTPAISEKFNCSYSLSSRYGELFATGGMGLSGHSEDGEVRIVELADHPFFLAMLFQPQLSSTKEHPHPVICRFLTQARNQALI